MSLQPSCKTHALPVTSICKVPGCASRLMCISCASQPHAQQHSASISSVNDFIFHQSRSKLEIISNIEKKVVEVDSNLGFFLSAIQNNLKQAEADIEILHQKFIEQMPSILGFVREQLSKDYREIQGRMVGIRQTLGQVKASSFAQNPSDPVAVYGKEPFETTVDKLLSRNSDLNQLDANLADVKAFSEEAFNNRVVYKINKKASELMEVLKANFGDLIYHFFKNIKLFLVRPQFENLFVSQFDKLKFHLERDLENFKKGGRDRKESAPSLANVSLSDIKSVLSSPQDFQVVEPKPLVLPEHIRVLQKHFVEFQNNRMSHSSFEKLVSQPSVLLEDGSIYEGQWDPVSNCRHGFGQCLMADGSYYQGYWMYGKQEIVGRFIYPNGDVFEGIIKKGKPNGRGILLNLNGFKYEGQFKDGFRNGTGVEEIPGAGGYSGDFYRDMHHGKGRLKNPDGTIYSGEFFEGKFNGLGSFVWPNGEQYTGEWFEDKKHGKGKYTYEDGRVYEGDFVNDLPHGYGSLNIPGKVAITTFWNKGEPTGLGLRTENDLKNTVIFDSDSAPQKDVSLSESRVQA